MAHTAQGCTGNYCLDDCSGLEMELPGVDEFKYPPLDVAASIHAHT